MCSTNRFRTGRRLKPFEQNERRQAYVAVARFKNGKTLQFPGCPPLAVMLLLLTALGIDQQASGLGEAFPGLAVALWANWRGHDSIFRLEPAQAALDDEHRR